MKINKKSPFKVRVRKNMASIMMLMITRQIITMIKNWSTFLIMTWKMVKNVNILIGRLCITIDKGMIKILLM